MKRLQLLGLSAILCITPSLAALASGQVQMQPFSLSQDCTEWTSGVPSFCTVIESNVAALKKGTKIFYYGPVIDKQAFGSNNVVLDDGAGDTANGNCIADYNAAKGMCAFYAGNGSLAGFTAIAETNTDNTWVWHWKGSYSISPSADAPK